MKKKLTEMTREELLEIVNKVESNDEILLKDCSTFEGWTKYYYCTGENVVLETMIQSKNIVSTMNHIETSEAYKEVMERFYNRRVDKFREVVEKTLYWEKLTKADEELQDYLWELSIKAHNIFKRCGFPSVANCDVLIDVTSLEETMAYYARVSNNIMVHEEVLRTHTADEIIEVLLHEYLHAFLDKYMSFIDSDIYSDDSIIFSAFASRLNRKLHHIGYGNLRVRQNGRRESRSLYGFRKEVFKLSDCRKSMITVMNEAKEITKEFIENYGSVKVLEKELWMEIIKAKEEKLMVA